MHSEPRKSSSKGQGFLHFDAERVLVNVRKADTEDLLDRVTAYRAGMEPAAIEIIEQELEVRGVTPAEIAARADQCRQQNVMLPDGTAATCSFCRRPAVVEAWGWHRLWGLLPVFPRLLKYCPDHCPERLQPRDQGERPA